MGVEKIDPEQFFKYLKNQAKIIRECPFDKFQIQRINCLVKIVVDFLKRDENVIIQNPTLAAESIFELQLALEIAYSNYRFENRNLWSKIFGFAASKTPKLEIQKILNH